MDDEPNCENTECDDNCNGECTSCSEDSCPDIVVGD